MFLFLYSAHWHQAVTKGCETFVEALSFAQFLSNLVHFLVEDLLKGIVEFLQVVELIYRRLVY